LNKFNEILDKTEYVKTNIPKYYDYINKLRLIHSQNVNLPKFQFIGQKIINGKKSDIGKLGIRVLGMDNINVSEFDKFWSLKDINYYFYQLQNRLRG